MLDQRDIAYIMDAHTNHPKKPSKAYRKRDGKTPFYMHPMWCAVTIVAEERLDYETRERGSQVLLYHDVVEDTTKPLPEWLSPQVKELVMHMTFEGGSAQEMQEVFGKPPEVRLLKMYDKVSNLLDCGWMDPEKKEKYRDYARRLMEDVERNFGELNITRLTRALIENGAST